MPLQFSTNLRTDILEAIETSIGNSPKLQIRTGAPPVNCAAADAGTLLVELNLPADWMANALNGTKGKSGVWSAQATAAGVAGHFRLKDAVGATEMQGNITISGGGGVMTLDNTNIAVNQSVTINNFTLTAGNI